MGEFMHAAGTAVGAAHAARSAVGKAGQRVGRAAATGGIGIAGSVAQGMKTFKETGSAGKAVGAGAVRGLGFAAHGIKNAAAKLLTGQETESHKNGISVGSSTGKDGKPLTHMEALRRAAGWPEKKNEGNEEKKEAAEKNALKVGGGDDDTSSGSGKLSIGSSRPHNNKPSRAGYGSGSTRASRNRR
jgi:hypothetical protein